MNNFQVDLDRCSQCGACVKSCQAELLLLDPYPTMLDNGLCILCGHCLAVCPTAAVSLGEETPGRALPAPGAHNPEVLKNLILGRRSMRHFKNKDVHFWIGIKLGFEYRLSYFTKIGKSAFGFPKPKYLESLPVDLMVIEAMPF